MTPPMLDHAAVREVLARSPVLGALPPEAHEELLAHLAQQTVPAGVVVIQEQTEADHYYLIAAGEAEVWVAKGGLPPQSAGTAPWTPDPARHTLLAHLGPGDGFGEMALLMGGLRRATVRAVSDLVLYTLDGPTFTQAVNQYRGLALALECEMALRGVAADLGRASPFARLPPAALSWLAPRLQAVAFEPGAPIIREGEPGDAFYIIRRGQVEVVAARADGSEYRISTLGAGDAFGEQALLTSEPRSATVRALEPVEVLRLTREDFVATLRMYQDRSNYFLQLTLQRQRPRRIAHWVMESQASSDGEVVYVLKDTEHNRYTKLSEQGAFLWDLMDGQTTVRDLTRAYFTRFKVFGLDAVLAAILQLNAAGFVQIQRVDAQQLAGAQEGTQPRRGRALRLRLPAATRYYSLPDVDHLVTNLYRYALRPLYFRPIQALLLFITLAGAAFFVRDVTMGGVPGAANTTAGGLAFVLTVGLFVQVVLHELAHAATTKHYGREVHRAGVGWYLFLPVAFVDTSDMWLSSRDRRAAVAFAGPYTNFLLSALATLAIPLVADPIARTLLFQFAATGFVLGLSNLNPLIEMDGYYVLMDWLDVPNLRVKALAFVGGMLWRTGPTTQNRRQRRIYTVYGTLALVYTLVVTVLVLRAYQGYVQGAVGNVLPPLVAGVLGWTIAALMAGLILRGAWRDLRRGVRRAPAPDAPLRKA
jgi:CRP-like cAMP-binding protein/Zn-dependent protease